jgi:hypothetical protein
LGLLRDACDDSLSPIILTAQRDGWVLSETKDDRHEAPRAHARRKMASARTPIAATKAAAPARSSGRPRTTAAKPAGGRRSSPSLSDQVLAVAGRKTQQEIAAACIAERMISLIAKSFHRTSTTKLTTRSLHDKKLRRGLQLLLVPQLPQQGPVTVAHLRGPQPASVCWRATAKARGQARALAQIMSAPPFPSTSASAASKSATGNSTPRSRRLTSHCQGARNEGRRNRSSALGKAFRSGGTESSNPASSSAESATNLVAAGGVARGWDSEF